MTWLRDERGYAMLAALVVMVMAAAFALVIVAAVGGAQAVETSDASGWRNDALTGEALDDAADEIRWLPDALSGVAEGPRAASSDGSWNATWSPDAVVNGDLWPRVRVRVEATTGRARRCSDVGTELRAELWASGVSCAGDVAVEAPLIVVGSGVYLGGSLSGRENVGFAQGAGPATSAGAPADLVHGDLCPEAAVHADGGIFAHDAEIHESPDETPWPLDTDVHAGAFAVGECVARPSPEFLVAAVEHAVPLGAAFSGTSLRLDCLALPQAGVETAAGGWCVMTPRIDRVEIAGVGPSDGTRLLVVVPGDAVLGDPTGETALAGGLVVCGELEVRGDLRIDGSLYAGRLLVSAPTRVTVAPEWRSRPLAGACLPVIAELGS